MNCRTQSALASILAGVSLGAVALVARWAPARRPDASSLAIAGEAGRAAPAVPTAVAPASPAPEAVSHAAQSATMGGDGAPSADGGAPAACPGDMALVDGDYCSMLAYSCLRPSDEAGYRCAEYLRGNRCLGTTERRRYCIDRHEWPNRLGAEPLVYVDWNEARSLCRGAGKRLCRRSEWTLACEGPKRLPYPWGFVRQPSPCNIDRAAFPADVTALDDERTRDDELRRLWQADPIGTHPDCVSSFGVFDMAGNVDEWTDDLADNPASQHPSTLNGGYWGPVRNTCRLTTTSHGPTFKFYQVGFRCCADASAAPDEAAP